MVKLRSIFSHRNKTLMRELVATEFKLRYQGSSLGYLWSLVRPLFLFAILLFVFGYVVRVGSDVEHYGIYLLLGIVLWNFFTEATNTGLQAIVNRGDLIRKINFPKYIIVVSGTISALINLGISLIVVLGFMIYEGIGLGPSALLFPLLVLELYLFSLALAFFLSALYVKYRDVNYIWELGIQAAFYATPILYPISLVLSKSTTLAEIMLLNPVAQIIQDARYLLITRQTETLVKLSHEPLLMAIPLGIVVVVIALAALYFRRSSKKFAEIV